MAKRISQETFDAAVAENVEEFEMSQAEALRDAITQFIGQGVDLTNIDTSGGVGRAEALAAIAALNAFASATSGGSTEDLLSQLTFLSSICDDKNMLSTRNQSLMLSQGGYNSLHVLIDGSRANEVTVASLKLISVICKTNGSIG